MPAPPPPPPHSQSMMMPVANAAVASHAAPMAVEDASPAPAPAPAPTRSKARARSKSPPPRRPPFHTYGRANTKPTVGGFLYGDYLATHNASAGASIRPTKRPTAWEMGGAQVHYMEKDMRHTHSAHYQPSPHPEPTPAPPELSAPARSKLSKPPLAAPLSPAALPEPPAAPPASAPASAEQHYASLPAYNPASYSCQQVGEGVGAAGPTFLPYYPTPLANYPPGVAPAPAAAGYYGQGLYDPQYAAAAPPSLVPFVPDAMGARLDPRRFKFAPRAAMGTVMPAGLRSIRRDNLVVG